MSEKESHIILREWLLRMQYPKERFPSEEQLKTVCVGKLRFFWRDVIKNVKPKQVVRQMKLNVFVNTVRKFESIEDSSVVKLGQVLPPAPLMLWRKRLALCSELDIQRKIALESESVLLNSVMKTKMKKTHLERTQKSIADKNREIHLLKETIKQLKDDIQHSKTVSHIAASIPCFENYKSQNDREHPFIDDCGYELKNNLTDEFCLSSPIPTAIKMTLDCNAATDEEYNAFCDMDFKHANKVDVEKILDKFDVTKLWNVLLKKRDAILENVLFMAGSADLTAELSSVARKSSVQKNFTPWKDNLAEMSALHCKLMIAGVRCLKQTKDAEKSFESLLRSKIIPAKLSRAQIDILKLQCKCVELKATLDSFKEDMIDVSNGRGIFTKYHSVHRDVDCDRAENFNQIMVNLKDAIFELQKSFSVKEEEVKSNITKLSESIVLMKDIQERVLEVLGYGEANLFSSMSFSNAMSRTDNDSLNASIMTSIVNLNASKLTLNDIMKVYSDSTCKDDIIDLSNMLSKEIDSVYRCGLDSQRKMVLDNGKEILLSDSLQHSNGIARDDEVIIYKYINPCSNISGIIKLFKNYSCWRKALQKLDERLSDESFITLLNLKSFDFAELHEKSDPRIGNIIKNIEKSLKPLTVMNDNIDNYYEKLEFFSNTKLKQFISDSRKCDGKNYSQCEYEISQLILDKTYYN